MDTRKNKKISHQKCYHQGKGTHKKPTNTFLVKKRLPCFGHVQRRDGDNVAKSVLHTQIEVSRPRGRPYLRWMDCVKDDMKQNMIRPEWTSGTDRGSWFDMIQTVNPTQETTRK